MNWMKKRRIKKAIKKISKTLEKTPINISLAFSNMVDDDSLEIIAKNVADIILEHRRKLEDELKTLKQSLYRRL